LIAELEDLDAGEDHYDAKFTVLTENVEHHIKEEEDELFQQIKKTAANSEELGRQMKQRKQELEREIKSSKEKSNQEKAVYAA